jgi:hypothetical protein
MASPESPDLVSVLFNALAAASMQAFSCPLHAARAALPQFSTLAETGAAPTAEANAGKAAS